MVALPAMSGGFGFAAVGHDGVVPTSHVFDGGCLTVALSRVGASGTGVILIETEAMHPTIIDLSAIVGGDHARGNTGRRGEWSRCMTGWSFGSSIGAVKSSLAGSEAAKMFLVGIVECGLEFGICSLVGRTGKPGFTSVGKDAT